MHKNPLKLVVKFTYTREIFKILSERFAMKKFLSTFNLIFFIETPPFCIDSQTPLHAAHYNISM